MDDALFRATLALAVPLAIEEMQQKPGILRAVRGQRQEIALAVGTFGDVVLYHDEITGPAFSVLVQAVAALAFNPEGVTVAGLHFQAQQGGA